MTDEELVTKALQGDQDAYTELYKKLLPRLKGTASTFLRNYPEDQEDFVQIAASKIFKNLDKFNGTAKFMSWATAVAKNEALTMLRSFNVRPNSVNSLSIDASIAEESSETFQIEDIERGYAAIDAKIDTAKILKDISPWRRQIIEHRFHKDLSIEETAKVLGVTKSSVKSLVHAGLEKCKAVAMLPKAKKEHIYIRCNYKSCNKLIDCYQSRPRIYCSRKCRRLDTQRVATCPWCTRQFKYAKSLERKFCSNRCTKAYQQRKYPAKEIIRLYVEERWSSVRIGRKFDCDPCSILAILHRNKIEVRTQKGSATCWCIEPGCNQPAYKVRHAGNGSMYGTRCKEHRVQHYNELNKWIRRKTFNIPPDKWLNLADKAWASLSIEMKEKLLNIAMAELKPNELGFIPPTDNAINQMVA